MGSVGAEPSDRPQGWVCPNPGSVGPALPMAMPHHAHPYLEPRIGHPRWNGRGGD